MSTFRVEGQLGLDGSRFFGVLGQAQTAVGRFGRNVTSSLGMRLAGMFSVGAVTAFARKTLEYADNIEEASQRIGVGVEKWQEWSFAAAQAGTSVEKLERFMLRLTNAAGDAKNLQGFAAMGINPQGMTPGGLFQAVNKFSQGKGSPEIMAALSQVGMDARSVSGALGVLMTDLDAAGASARGLGAVMTKETINTLAKLNDQLSIVSKILMSQFAPALLNIAQQIARTFGRVSGGAAVLKQSGVWEGFKESFKNLDPVPFVKSLLKAGADIADPPMLSALNKAFTGPIDEIEEMLKRLMAYTGPAAGADPTITVTERGRAKKAAEKSAPVSDSLVAIGNYLGASNRLTIVNIAQQQLLEQKRTNQFLDNIDRTLSEGDDTYYP